MQNRSSLVNRQNIDSLANQSAPYLIVFGGTSGIGLALALHHLKLGWQVCVIGHSLAKIATINKEYAEIITYHCDLSDLAQRQRLLNDLDKISFDRLIYSAGSYLNERVHRLDRADSDLMLAINLQAFGEVLAWGTQQLKSQQPDSQGVECLSTSPKSLISIASIAGTMDYPYASLYAKSKRAMIATTSAYRLALAPYDIQVTCIASGYVDTQALRDLNEGNASHKPFIISVDQAVEHIMQAIDEDVELAVFPKPLYYITRILSNLPKPILNRILRGKSDN